MKKYLKYVNNTQLNKQIKSDKIFNKKSKIFNNTFYQCFVKQIILNVHLFRYLLSIIEQQQQQKQKQQQQHQQQQLCFKLSQINNIALTLFNQCFQLYDIILIIFAAHHPMMKQFLGSSPSPLQSALDLINLLCNTRRPQTLYSQLTCYQECRDEQLKEQFRFKAEEVLATINKKQVVPELIKSIKQSQINLKRYSQQNIKSKQAQTLYLLTAEQLEKELVNLMKNIGSIDRNQEKEIIKINNYKLSQDLTNILIYYNRTQRKYQFLHNAIRSYNPDKQRTIGQLIGKTNLQQFYDYEFAAIAQFDQYTTKKSSFSFWKSAKDSDYYQQILELTLDQVKLNPEITIAQLKKKHDKISESKILSIFFKNVKQKHLVEKILEQLTSDKTHQLSKSFNKTQYDSELEPKTKVNLGKINRQLSELLQIKSALLDAGFQSMNHKAAVIYVMDYMKKVSTVSKLLLKQLQIQPKQQHTNFMTNTSINIDNKNIKYDIDPYNLSECLYKLLQFLNSDRTSLTNTTTTNNKNNQNEKVVAFDKHQNQVQDKFLLLNSQTRKQLEANKTKIKQLNKQIEKRDKQITQYKNQINKLNEQINTMENKLKQQQNTVYFVQNQQKVKNIPQDKQSNKKQQENQNNQNLRGLISKTQLDEQKQKIITEYNQFMNKINVELQQCKQELTTERISFYKQTQNLQKINKMQQKQNLQLKKELNQRDILLKNQQSHIREMQQNLNAQKYQRQELENKLKNYEQELQVKNNRIDDLSIQIEKLYEKIKQLEDNQPMFKERAYRGQFSGDIFDSSQLSGQQKPKLMMNLIGNIEKLIQKTFLRTKLIYKIDHKNKTSVHAYIDGIPNWVALFKLKNNIIVGAFCQAPIEPKTSSEVGLLFNLNTEKYYGLQKQTKHKCSVFSYDQFYLVIGNSEIRYKFQEDKIETQFGGTYKYFDTGKTKAAEFFAAQGENGLEITHLQFHQVVFS